LNYRIHQRQLHQALNICLSEQNIIFLKFKIVKL
jgi:hypothetical protein